MAPSSSPWSGLSPSDNQPDHSSAMSTMPPANVEQTNGIATLPGDPSIPFPAKCFWWKLPRELRDRILRLAYNNTTHLKVACLKYRETRNRTTKLTQTYYRGPVAPTGLWNPDMYVNYIMVCKQWAIEGLEATFWHRYIVLPPQGLRPDRYQSTTLMLRSEHITRLAGGLNIPVEYGQDIMLACPNIKELQVITAKNKFTKVFPQGGSTVLAEEKRVNNKIQRYNSHALCGLSEVSFVMTRHKEDVAERSRHRAGTKTNVMVIMTAIARSLLRPKATASGNAADQSSVASNIRPARSVNIEAVAIEEDEVAHFIDGIFSTLSARFTLE